MAITEEQRAERRTGLGSSDAAAACGVHPFTTPYQLYLEKIGAAPPFEGNEFTKWGEYLEPAVRQEYAEQTGRTVRLPKTTFRHERYPFLLAHPDGVTDDRRLYEGKNTRSYEGWGPSGSDEYPDHHYLQVQHGMLVLGLEVADLCVLIAGSDWRWYEIPADRELWQMLIEEEAAFWGRVERRDPPPLAGPDDVQLRYGRLQAGGTIEADDQALAAVDELRELRHQAKVTAEAIAETETWLKKYLGEREALVRNGKPIVTWSTVRGRTRLDETALRRDHPELAAQFTVTGDPYRRFVLKGAKR